jgi:hypothetical protein
MSLPSYIHIIFSTLISFPMDDSAYTSIQCCTVQYSTVQYSAVQCSTVHANSYLCMSIYVSLNNSYSSILNVMTEQSNFMPSSTCNCVNHKNAANGMCPMSG